MLPRFLLGELNIFSLQEGMKMSPHVLFEELSVFSTQQGSRIRPCFLVGGITRTFRSMLSKEGRKNLCVLSEELKGLFHVKWEQEESVCPSRRTWRLFHTGRDQVATLYLSCVTKRFSIHEGIRMREHKSSCDQFEELNVLFHVGGKHKSPYAPSLRN